MTALLALALAVQDQDNPEFKGWATFKAGSSVTFRIQNERKPVPVEEKTTLKSAGAKEVVLSVETISGGKAVDKPVERKVSPKIPSAEAPKKLKEGDEEIDVAGKKLNCHWTEVERTLKDGKTETLKMWASDDVPGKLARVESYTDEGGKTIRSLTAWEKK